MKKEPVVTGGNTEAAPASRALIRYIKEGMKQDHCSQQDAAMNAFVFACGVCMTMGATLPQMFFCFISLTWQVMKAKIKRK